MVTDGPSRPGDGSGKAPTLRDVAARAFVNPSVVSRVLNSDPTLKISADTRRRVVEAIAALRYRPNALARGLRLARTSTIGFVLPEVANPVYSPIVIGAQRRAAEAGFVILLGSGRDAASAEASFARLLSEGRVDGLLIASATIEDQLIRDLVSGPAPIVIVNRRVDGVIGSVIVDDEAGSRTATEHLIGLGHSRIAHVAGPADIDTTMRRRAGYEAAMLRGGFQLRVVSGDGWDAVAGYRAAERLFKENGGVTAVFAANVMVAIGVVRAAREADRIVPRDLSVIALHDFGLAAFIEPPLTTVAMPLEELGSAAVDVLLDRLAGAPAGDLVIQTPPRLILRSSTGPPSTGAPSKAVDGQRL